MSCSFVLRTLSAIVLVATTSAAQSSVKLYDEGQFLALPCGRFVDATWDLAAQDGGSNGTWWAEVDTSLPDDRVLFGSGFFTRTGSPIANLPSDVLVSEYLSFYAAPGCPSPVGIVGLANCDVTVTPSCDPTIPPTCNPPPATPVTSGDDRALVWGAFSIRRENDLSTAPQVTSGTKHHTLLQSRFSTPQLGIVLERMNDPAVPGFEFAAVRFDLLPAGCTVPTQIAEQVLVRQGDAIPGAAGVMTGFASVEKRSFDINAVGDYMFVATFDDTLLSRRVVLNGVAVLEEQDPVAAGSGNVENLHLVALDLNDLGDFVIQTDTTTGSAILRGHVSTPGAMTKLVQAGDTVPDPIAGSFVMTKIGHASASQARDWAPAHVTNSGDVVWYGEWSDPDQTQNSGIFINRRLIVREGSQQGGETIHALGSASTGFRYSIDVSPNGRYLVYAAITDAPNADHSVFLMDLGESVPFGTVVQGCTYPYPAPNLDHVSDNPYILPGQVEGGLPLVNHEFYVTVDSSPPLTSSITLVFYSSGHANYPCGSVLPTMEYLLGSGLQGSFTKTGAAPKAFRIPPDLGGTVPPAFLNVESYAQAFFKNAAGTTIGATNGIRFVFGAE